MAWFIAGFVALKLIGVTFVILLVSRVVVAFRGRHDRASDILRGRLASGEITEDQFRHLRDVLDV